MHGISGWVRNLAGQVEIFAQGDAAALEQFNASLIQSAPPLSEPHLLERSPAVIENVTGFSILPSEAAHAADIHVPPDFFACDDCLRELRDPSDRRYRYPFINCTQCGPRYTLIQKLPYDRPNTSMAGFALCPACLREYTDPADRRFHAEPVACPICGPKLQFHYKENHTDGTEASLDACIAALRNGLIVAVKGIGGYHLMCDAANDSAVQRLRALKPRPHKPLAVMFPARGSDSLDAVREAACLTLPEQSLLRSPMRPIVLLSKNNAAALSTHLAPGLNEIGIMLPYSPLHHLLLDALGSSLVATSANISGEPVLTVNAEAEARLSHTADAFLHHNRPILRPADDPVFRIIAGTPRPLRLGRGCTPLELTLPFALREPLLAVGGHMKNTIALAWDKRVVISPHIGELNTPRSLAVFEQLIADLQHLYGVQARTIVCDAHPGYVSTRWAEDSGLPVTRVWHHHAHASALAGEFPEAMQWLVFAWDGTGLGEDGTLWGGEALLGRPGTWRRAASMRPFHLPGGERAGREPWRSAASLCWEAGVTWDDLPENSSLLQQAWQRRLNCPQTSAVGRLFDAAAALTGLLQQASFEGQGPMLLETIASREAPPIMLPLRKNAAGVWESDWAPLLPHLLDTALPAAQRAGTFHASMAQALVDQALQLRTEHGINTIGLCGGVFQNRVLSETAIALLQLHDFDVRFGRRVPCNDAGLSYGQIIETGSAP